MDALQPVLLGPGLCYTTKQDKNVYFHPLRVILPEHINALRKIKTDLGPSRLELNNVNVQSVSWILAEFYFNRGLQRLYTGTCIILQKTINEFLCLLIVFLKSKTYQLILKDVIKLNRNLR